MNSLHKFLRSVNASTFFEFYLRGYEGSDEGILFCLCKTMNKRRVNRILDKYILALDDFLFPEESDFVPIRINLRQRVFDSWRNIAQYNIDPEFEDAVLVESFSPMDII